MTLDYYFIALEDRIWVSSNFNVGPAERAQLIALGVPGAAELTSLRFFTNDMDTETSGFELVANYNIEWSGGNTLFSLAANVNETKVTRRTDRQSDPMNSTPVYYLGDRDVFDLENRDPDFRAISPAGIAGPMAFPPPCAATGTVTTGYPVCRLTSSEDERRCLLGSRSHLGCQRCSERILRRQQCLRRSSRYCARLFGLLWLCQGLQLSDGLARSVLLRSRCSQVELTTDYADPMVTALSPT